MKNLMNLIKFCCSKTINVNVFENCLYSIFVIRRATRHCLGDENIVKSRWQQGVKWPSFDIHAYHPSHLAGLLGCVLCPNRFDVYRFLLVGQHWHVYVSLPVCGQPYIHSPLWALLRWITACHSRNAKLV